MSSPRMCRRRPDLAIRSAVTARAQYRRRPLADAERRALDILYSVPAFMLCSVFNCVQFTVQGAFAFRGYRGAVVRADADTDQEQDVCAVRSACEQQQAFYVEYGGRGASRGGNVPSGRASGVGWVKKSRTSDEANRGTTNGERERAPATLPQTIAAASPPTTTAVQAGLRLTWQRAWPHRCPPRVRAPRPWPRPCHSPPPRGAARRRTQRARPGRRGARASRGT